MHKSTLYIIASTRVQAGARRALAALGVLLFIFTSCAKTQLIQEIKEIDTSGTDPMNFVCNAEAGTDQATKAAKATKATSAQETKAAQPLTSGFIVSTYKHYGDASRQFPVMDGYNVEYKTSGTAWDGSVRPYWDYTGVPGQYEKFWDFSAFPYRFHAVAPYPQDGGVSYNDVSLSISRPYMMQTVHNGLVSPSAREAEPYLAAQLQRGTDGRDYDHLATNHPREVNTGSTARNRYVALPFHHLNSKVRFGIYCTAPWATINPLYIEGLTVKVASSNFVTQADGYTSPGADADHSWYLGTGNSGFTGLTEVADPGTQLLRFDGGKEVADNDLSRHQGRSSAYWLQCPDGIMQIPQENVQLLVSLRVMKMDGTLYKEFTNVLIRMEDGTTTYDWKSGYINTYYLIIGEIEEKLEIEFTCTLSPWEDVSGSLSTDLEK